MTNDKTGIRSQSQEIRENHIYKIPKDTTAIYAKYPVEWLETKEIDQFNKDEHNFLLGERTILNADRSSMIFHEENMPAVEKKITKDSLEEGLIALHEKKNKPILDEKTFLEKEMKKQQDRLRIISNIDISNDLVANQSHLFEEIKIIKFNIVGEKIIIDIEFPEMAFPVVFSSDYGRTMNSSDGSEINSEARTAFRTLFPTRACVLQIIHHTVGGLVQVKNISKYKRAVTMHITDSCCLGTYEGVLTELATKQDYGAMANILADYICTYYENSPFFRADTPFWSSPNVGEKLSLLYLWDTERMNQYLSYKAANGQIMQIKSKKLRKSMPNELRTIMEEAIADLKAIKIPAWLKAKTGLGQIFEMTEVPIDFARTQKEAVTWNPDIERSWFNQELIKFIN